MNGRPHDDDTIPGDGATDGGVSDPRLDAALDAIRRTTVPEEALRRVASAARALPTGTIATAPHRPARSGDRRPSRVRRVIALAAGLGALVILATLVPPLVARQRATAAFAEVVERAKGATSVRFTTTQRLGPGPALKGRQLVAGRRTRHEMVDGPLVMIMDLERRQLLTLDTTNKRAESSPLEKEVIDLVTDPVEQLARVAEQGVEPVPGEPDTFRGKWVFITGLANVPDMTVVVDPDSRLPTRIVISDPDPKHPFEVILDDFHWNEPVDESLLSIDPPEGYEIRKGLLSLNADVPAAPLPAVVNGRVIQDRVPAAILWSTDGTRLTTLVRDPEETLPPFKPNQLRQWDLATGQLRWSEEVGGAGQAAMTADGRHLAVVVGYEIQLRDAQTGATKSTWTTKERLGPLAFSPDGTTLAAGITEWGPYGGRSPVPKG